MSLFYFLFSYRRLILLTDADADGAHIRSLLLAFLLRYFPSLIQNGQVSIARPPLFRISHPPLSLEELQRLKGEAAGEHPCRPPLGTKERSAKVSESFVWSQAEASRLCAAVARLLKRGVESPRLTKLPTEQRALAASLRLQEAGVRLQRFKGLGEMQTSQLWEAAMNPSTRVTEVVALEQASRVGSLFFPSEAQVLFAATPKPCRHSPAGPRGEDLFFSRRVLLRRKRRCRRFSERTFQCGDSCWRAPGKSALWMRRWKCERQLLVKVSRGVFTLLELSC